MRSKFKWIFTLALAFLVQFSFAQERTITGVVTENGMPLPGATVVIKGTKTGTQADFDGKYTIKAKQGDVLEFSYVGMKTKTATVGASNTVSVTMEADNTLEEVVITGYGRDIGKTQRISAVASVTAKEIENRPNINFLNTIQGQIAGANISSFSGQPGTNKVDVIIRGVSTLNGTTDPLYVIDGMPLNQAFFRNLNPNEIENVSVLKDAAATSIYGNRGTNGVIVVTTKKGKYSSMFETSYSSSYGFTEFRGDDYNLPTAIEHLKLQKLGFDRGVAAMAGSLAVSGNYLARTNGTFAVTANPANLDAFAINTDWQKEFLRTGVTFSHDLSFTTGSEKLNNYTAIGYFDQEGIVPTTKFKRFTLRSNFNGKSTNDKFNYGINFFGAFSNRTQLEQETRGGINNNVLQNPLTGYLNSPRFVDRNLYQSGQQLFNEFGNPALNLTPLMLIDLFQPKNAPSFFNEQKLIITSNLGYKLHKNWTISNNTGIDFADDKRNFAIGPRAYLSVVRASGASQPLHGLETVSSSLEFTFNTTNRINFKKTYKEKHNVDFSIYQEYVRAHRLSNGFTQIGLDPLTWEPGAGTGYLTYNPVNNAMPLSYRPSLFQGNQNAGLVSFFSTLDYDYSERFGFTSTIRRDGSYRFSEKNRWGTFWSVGGRWNVNNEKFLKDSKWISELKLRASYGTTGNQNVVGRGVDSNFSPIFLGNQLIRDLNASATGYNNSQAFAVSSYANEDLKWETTKQWNVGFDLGLKRRFNVGFDIYSKRTVDLYVQTPISAGNGITSLATNNGSLENNGIELNLRYDVFKKADFNLTVFANGAFNRSRFLDLGTLDPNQTGRFRVATAFQYAIGGLINEHFAVPYVGVNPTNGNLQFLDINNNITEAPTDADRRGLDKNALPLYQGGFGLNAEYKGFFLDLLFTYAFGAWKYDSDYDSLMDIRNAVEFPVSNDLQNAWSPTNTNTDIPALTATNYELGDISDRFLRSASYIRLRNISFGYRVPNRFLKKTGLSALTLRAQAENYVTWTNWKGFDPESFVNSQVGYYPTPKILTFGIDLKF
jgi:TonB-linked SusC/RagA family outer membrane protein